MEYGNEDDSLLATESSLLEVSCTRAISGTAYGQGQQEYVWSISSPSVWFPDKSFMRYDLELYGPGDPATTANAPTVSDGLAYAENCIANSITGAYLYGGGAIISSVTSMYPQVHALAARTRRSAAWMEAQGTGFAQCASLSERIAAISATSLGGAPVGLSGLDDCRDEIYKPCVHSHAATLAVTAVPLPGLPVLISGSTADELATSFAIGTADAGVVIKFNDVATGNYNTYTIVSVAVDGGTGVQSITCVGSSGEAALAATSKWHAIRRTLRRSDQTRHKISLLFKPCLGIFEVRRAMGSGTYRLSLSINPNFRLSMVETLDKAFAATGADTRYRIHVADVKFFAAVAKLNLDDRIIGLSLREYDAVPRAMGGTKGTFQFQIKPSTTIIYVALQHKSAGSDPAWSPSRFISTDNCDLNLKNLTLTYGGVSKPMFRLSSGFTAGKNDLQQMYEMFLQAGNRELTPGGAESVNDWLQRGPVFGFKFDRDAKSRDTELSVVVEYENPEGGTFNNESQLFIITQYMRAATVTHSGGMITEVVSRDI